MKTVAHRSIAWPVLGFLAAVAITSAMDASGASAFSALPLFPLLVLFGYLQRFSLAELGFAWGHGRVLRDYSAAVLYPVAVMAAIVGIAAVTGALAPGAAPHSKLPALLKFVLLVATTIPVALVTEEGFFRGWLWASLKRAGRPNAELVVLTSIAFALWHWSSVMLPTGFNPPPAQVPTFMLNAVLLGANWAMLRLLSGSLFVTSVSHGVWNGLAYVLFGFGERVGSLGIANTAVYGPEIGVLGLALNAAAAAALAILCVRNNAFTQRPAVA